MCHGMTAEKFISQLPPPTTGMEKWKDKETKCERKRKSVKSMKKFDL